MKLSSIVIKPSSTPFFFELWSPFNRQLNEAMKQLPGASNRKSDTGEWRHVFGADLIPIVEEVCEAIFKQKPAKMFGQEAREWGTALRPYQLEYVDKALSLGGAAAFFDMGLGKTPAALTVAKIVGGKVLVITPPRVVLDFRAQVERWLGRPDVEVWPHKKTIGPKDAPSDFDSVAILSFHRLHYILNSESWQSWLRDVKVVIVDEVQNFKTYTAACTKNLTAVLKLIPSSMRLPLSGTPMPDRPKDIFQALHVCWPWLFGPFAIPASADRDGTKPPRANFRDRYLRTEHNGYGLEVVGLNERYAPELKARIAACSVRATKEDWAHLLPPFLLHRIEVEAPKGRELWNEDRLTETEMLAEMARLSEPKAAATIDHALTVWRDEAPGKLAIVTYHRAVAEQITAALADAGLPTHLVMGGMSDFDQRIAEATHPGEPAVLVATMDSIREGLNRLVCFSRFIFAELYFRPASVAQAMGRFHRLTSTAPVTGDVVFCPGTLDERIYASLSGKLNQIGQLIKQGGAEAAIENLDGGGDDWQAAFRKALE